MSIPQLQMTLVSKNKDEFSFEEWEGLVKSDPVFHSLWVKSRLENHSFLWFPETQETEKVFYFIPTPIDKRVELE
jgi:hypothetical protein